MNLLIDFINVQEWSVDELLKLHQKYGLYITREGKKQGCDMFLLSRPLQSSLFLFGKDVPTPEYFKEMRAVLPDDEEYDDLFAHFEVLQMEWSVRLEETIKKGPIFDFLNQTMSITHLIFLEGETPWRPQLRRDFYTAKTFEDHLEYDYAYPFIAGCGEDYKAVRTCKNPKCKRWFIYNRPKQLFCSHKCRLDYHNANADKAKRAAIARQKRAEGLWQ